MRIVFYAKLYILPKYGRKGTKKIPHTQEYAGFFLNLGVIIID